MIVEKYEKNTRDDAGKLLLHSVDEIKRIGNESESRPKSKKHCTGRKSNKKIKQGYIA